MKVSELLDHVILLEPAVEVVAEAQDSGPARRRPASLIVNHRWQSVMVAPGGADSGPLLESLREGMSVSVLLDEIGDPDVAERLISALVRRGHAYLLDPQESSLDAARRGWRAQAAGWLRVEIRAVLTGQDDGAGIADRLRQVAVPPNLVLVTESLEASADSLVQLFSQLQKGNLHFHTMRIEIGDGAASGRVLNAMAGLQAVAIVDGSPDRSPPDWVGGLIRARIPVLAACRIDPALLDGEAGYRAWVAKHRLAGLRLADWAEALSAGAVDPTGLAARVHELEEALGWVELRGIASDAVVFGEEQPADDELGDERDDGPVERFRRQHLVSRARGIRAEEGRQVWAQVPSAEELWVPSEADYVPGHPGEVGLAPGVTVADIASGYGRVARRIAPLVSPGGAIVCVEKASVSLDRARRFAAEGGFTNILALQGLAQRLPLETDTFDLAIMEWAGQVMRTVATEAVAEMARVVRPGGRVIVTHRLVRLVLNDLGQADASSPDVFSHFQAAFAHADLEILTRRFWGCQDRLSDLPMALFEEQWLPRALDELRGRHYPPLEETADIYLTVIARKKPPAGA